MSKAPDLLQGTLDMLILKAVSLGTTHGYGVLLRIQQASGDTLAIQQGSLYPTLVVAGLALGLGVSWLGASALQGFVFGVGVRDAVTFVVVPLVFLVVGFMASYLPARRATMVAPREVLEGE